MPNRTMYLISSAGAGTCAAVMLCCMNVLRCVALCCVVTKGERDASQQNSGKKEREGNEIRNAELKVRLTFFFLSFSTLSSSHSLSKGRTNTNDQLMHDRWDIWHDMG